MAESSRGAADIRNKMFNILFFPVTRAAKNGYCTPEFESQSFFPRLGSDPERASSGPRLRRPGIVDAGSRHPPFLPVINIIRSQWIYSKAFYGEHPPATVGHGRLLLLPIEGPAADAGSCPHDHAALPAARQTLRSRPGRPRDDHPELNNPTVKTTFLGTG